MCLYVDRNDPVERGKWMILERGEIIAEVDETHKGRGVSFGKSERASPSWQAYDKSYIVHWVDVGVQ